ncbi:hypothetical protein J6590_010341 [Homalodisca vitripennis]|nr:hypothetical protein J6590_010341 [Homalodisca vitripennis]
MYGPKYRYPYYDESGRGKLLYGYGGPHLDTTLDTGLTNINLCSVTDPSTATRTTTRAAEASFCTATEVQTSTSTNPTRPLRVYTNLLLVLHSLRFSQRWLHVTMTEHSVVKANQAGI